MRFLTGTDGTTPGRSREGDRSEPIVIIDRSEIREGRLEALQTAMRELVAFAQANEPRMIAYGVYLNEDATQVTVWQVHPDAASAELHMTVAGARFAGFADLIRLRGIDVYGRPTADLRDRLERKAVMLGGNSVTVHDLYTGFTRFG